MGARLCAYVRRVVDVVKMRENDSILLGKHVGWEKGDWTCPGIWLGSNVFAHGGYPLLSPQAHVSVSGIA